MHRHPSLTFNAIYEPLPGSRLGGLFNSHWPGYRKWFLREGDSKRPSYLKSRRMLSSHMPELEGTYDSILELIDGSDSQARCLALYCPTPFFSGCSQAVWSRGPLALIRNYDYAPQLCDGMILFSAWNGTRVIATSDCLWGALDGMNEHGLAVSLAFGGRKVVGEGFGISLVVRYILETCRDTHDATEVLQRVPVHMAYNITMLDRSGDYATAMVSPDREASIRHLDVATNFQGMVEWPEHATFFDTLGRQRFLEQCLRDPGETLETVVARLLHAPLYRPIDQQGWGTLYSVRYDPVRGSICYLWPGKLWEFSFRVFEPGRYTAHYQHVPVHIHGSHQA